jgi:hypothetical protein
VDGGAHPDAAGGDAPPHEIAQHCELLDRAGGFAEALLDGVHAVAQHVVQLVDVLRDAIHRHAQHEVRAERRHPYAEQIRARRRIGVRRNGQPFALHACDPGSFEPAPGRRPIRDAERLVQVEHQLDIAVRQDLLMQVRDASARYPEAVDDAAQIRRRRGEQKLP